MQTIIIDTREPHEYERSHVDGAVNLPPQQFMTGSVPAALESTPKDTKILLYCRSGMRSNTVGHMLEQYGFTNIINGVNEQHVQKLLSDR